MSIFNILKKHTKKMILICVFLVAQFLNFTGFCYSEGKYLSEEELLRRAGGKLYEQNPDCCTVSYGHYDSLVFHSPALVFLSNVLGERLYGFQYASARDVSPYEHDHPPTPYRIGHGSVNACGSGGHEEYSENITEEEYKKYVDMVKSDRNKE